MPLQWERIGQGYARTTCGRYQMSIARVIRNEEPVTLYTAFVITGNTDAPIANIGLRYTPEAAKQLCEEHHERLCPR